jgi:hypothetical protein
MFIIAGRSLEVYLHPPSSLHILTKNASFASRCIQEPGKDPERGEAHTLTIGVSWEQHGNDSDGESDSIGVDGDRRGRRSQCCAERGRVQKY